MTVEDDVRANSRDIQTLTNTVTKLATIVEGAEKRRDDDMSVIKDAVKSINDLNHQMTATIGMQKDIEVIVGKMSECREDIRVLRHDVNGLKPLGDVVVNMNQKLAETNAKVDGHGKLISDWSNRTEKQGEQMSDVTSEIAALKADTATLKEWKVSTEGAKGALKWAGGVFWTVALAVAGIAGFFLKDYFGKGNGQ